MAGKRPKLEALKEAGGRPGKRAPKHNAKFRLALPEPPESVTTDKLALQLWHFVAAELLRAGVITPLYGAIIGNFCLAYSRAQVLSRLAGPIFRRLLHALELAEKEPGDLGKHLLAAGMLTPGKSGLEITGILDMALRVEKDSLMHLKDARGCMVEMGMTPAAYSRLRFPGPENEAESKREEELNELAGAP